MFILKLSGIQDEFMILLACAFNLFFPSILQAKRKERTKMIYYSYFLLPYNCCIFPFSLKLLKSFLIINLAIQLLTIYVSIYLCIQQTFHNLSIDINLLIYRSINLSIYQSNNLSIYLFLCLFIYFCIYLSIFVSIYLFLYLFIFFCIYLSIFVSIYLFLYLSIYFSIYPSIFLSIFLFSIYLFSFLSIYIFLYFYIDYLSLSRL